MKLSSPTYRTLAAASFAGLVAAALAVGVAVPDARSAPESATWAVDPVHSHVLFKVRHMGASWSWGRFNEMTATVETDDAGADLRGVAFEVKAESVDTQNAKRDQHLRGPDFFSAKEFPTISFRSTSVAAAGEGAWDVTGDLSLHGTTKPVTARVVRVGTGKGRGGETLAGWEATLSVKRSEFGMSGMIGPVGDDVALIVDVEAARK